MGGWAPNYQIHSLLNYQEEVHQYASTFEAGRMLAGTHGNGFLAGRPEAVVEITPFWINHEPHQIDKVYCCGNSGPFLGGFLGGYYHGIAATPALLRWNFIKQRSSRLIPYAQGGFGLLWTTKVYPQYALGRYTSRFNFTPQLGAGESFFVRKNQSIDIGVRFIHATSWGLGEYNPGVSSLQFTAGYSWWK